MTNHLLFFRRSAACLFALLTCLDVDAFASQSAGSTSPSPLVITKGGTYSGTWSSNDPTIPAVLINTDQPVTLQNATLSGRGHLIVVNGNYGAHVTINNVTGMAMDPGVAGRQRGAFVRATKAVSLKVTHCSMYGVSFGVEILYSAMQSLTVSQNMASELEDRASDGDGGFLSSRPDLGHFFMVNQVIALNGADISWNQVIDTVGASSTEDVINIYKSQGAPQHPIHIHDNYLEGFSSAGAPSYTGVGVIADGDGQVPDTTNVLIDNNEMVHAAGSGVEIATGSNIAVRANRIVSCGVDDAGNWIAMPFVNAIVVWNYYGTPLFVNNSVRGTKGGMLRPSADGTPMVADLWARTGDLAQTDSLGPNDFTDPCLVDGRVNPEAEDAERDFWQEKLAMAHVTVGAHTNQ